MFDGDRSTWATVQMELATLRGDVARARSFADTAQMVFADQNQGAYYQHQLMRVYLLVGENEKALDILEQLVRIPYLLTPAWIRIDPTFAPLEGNPRFERILQSTPSV